MRKNIFSILLMIIAAYSICYPLTSFGVTVNVSTPGTLETMIDEIDDYSFPELIVTGELNAIDIVFLRSQSGRLATVERLDLSGVSIVEGGGAYVTISYQGGTETIDNYKYTFYYSHEYKSEKSVTSNMLGGSNCVITTYTDDLSGMFYGLNYPKIVIPSSIKRISLLMFAKSHIHSVISSAPLESIGDEAFSNCTALENINIDSIHEIGAKAFNGCENLVFSADSTLNIPLVENISHSAFYNCKGIGKVNLSPTLKTIGNKAFNYCENITECPIPSSVKSIGEYAFYGCKKIRSVTLPEGLENIGSSAFARCDSLKVALIGGNPKGLSQTTFSGTPFFDSLKSEEDNIVYLNSVAIMEKPRKSTPHTLTFKEGTVEIGDDFLQGSYGYVTSVELPSTVRRIGNRAFGNGYNISEVSEVNLPNGLEDIGSYAFYNSKLTEISLPASLRSIGKYAFYNCEQLQGELIIPENITNIGYNAFEGSKLFQIDVRAENLSECDGICSTAERLKVGPKVKVLPRAMFRSADINKITFEERTDESQLLIEDECFMYCSELKSLSLPKGNIEIGSCAFSYCNFSELTMNGVVTKIGERAFERNKIRELSFNDGLERIGESAFADCDSLKNANLGKTVKYIGGGAFSGCNELEQIYLGEVLDSLCGSAFGSCESLDGVELPQSLKYLGDNAFWGCRSLKAIQIPQEIDSIHSYTFNRCSSLTSVDLPENLKSIGRGAFAFCSGLTTIEFPASLESIDYEAFDYCSALQDIVCLSMVPPTTQASAFNRVNATLHVYEDALQYYKETYPWSRFKIEPMAGGDGGPKICATPTISFVDGELRFTCNTEGAEIFYRLTSEDIKSYDTPVVTASIPLSACYDISCYAKAQGYVKSPTVNVKLCWLTASDGNDTDIINTGTSRGVVLSASNGIITITGLDSGEVVGLYSISGVKITQSTATNGSVQLNNTSGEQVVVICIGRQSIKMAMN